MRKPLLSLVRQGLRREWSECAGPIETSQTWDPTPKTDLPTKQLQGAMLKTETWINGGTTLEMTSIKMINFQYTKLETHGS